MSIWYTQTSAKILEELTSHQHGLSSASVKERAEKYGQNSLPEAKSDSYFTIFLRQFISPIIYILLFSALIMLFMKEVADSLIILFVLVINAIVGAVQEGKAQNTLLALKKFVATNAAVLRDEREIIIPDSDLVPGDVIVLKEGDKVPADARIIDQSSLKVDESSLTGESEPILKITEPISKEGLAVPEQKNMLFRGTYVVGGTGTAVVVATGISTEIGKISAKIQTIDTDVPLKVHIEALSKLIIWIVLAISFFIFVVGIFYGIEARDMFATVVAICVSAIPEGLPVVVTLILATGVSRMSKRSALVKKLPAVEALGQAKIIAVDKTGTITLNQMMVCKLFIGDKHYDVTGNGYDPNGEVIHDGKQVEPLNHQGVLFLGKIAAFTSSATNAYSEEKKEWIRVSGDPTESALLTFSQKVGYNRQDLLNESKQVMEIPFNSSLKYHAVVNQVEGKPVISLTGAPEVILEYCKTMWKDGKEISISSAEHAKLHETLKEISQEGLRVLALATCFKSPDVFDPNTLPPLCFVGFVGIVDGIRQEVSQAVKDGMEAGVRFVMITGDHVETARAIAKKIGIYRHGDHVVTGNDLTNKPEKDIVAMLDKVSVFARVTSEHKLKIIELFRSKGDTIAMTGDGVNDALSLAAADLGIAMGRDGTEVAKEAADIVLMDDNLGSIVAAIEEGRNIYKTIKKVILYLFSTGLGEILAIVAAIFMGYPLPVLASQIIWLNFVTDGFLVVALALEPKEVVILKEPLVKSKKWIFDGTMFLRMLTMAIIMTVTTLYMFDEYLAGGYVKATTVALTTLAVLQWFNVWNCRSEKKSIFDSNPFDNMYLVAATVIVILLQIFAVYHPFMQKILHTAALTLNDWLVIIAASVFIIIVEEFRKFFAKK